MTHHKTAYRPLHLFDELFQNLGTPAVSAGLPAVNVSESADQWQLDLMVPGYAKEAFSIEAENGLLTIKAEKPQENVTEGQQLRRREFKLNGFKRTFSLDEKMDTEAISAKYENGILHIFLPKKEKEKSQPKLISIQ